MNFVLVYYVWFIFAGLPTPAKCKVYEATMEACMEDKIALEKDRKSGAFNASCVRIEEN